MISSVFVGMTYFKAMVCHLARMNYGLLRMFGHELS